LTVVVVVVVVDSPDWRLLLFSRTLFAGEDSAGNLENLAAGASSIESWTAAEKQQQHNEYGQQQQQRCSSVVVVVVKDASSGDNVAHHMAHPLQHRFLVLSDFVPAPHLPCTNPSISQAPLKLFPDPPLKFVATASLVQAQQAKQKLQRSFHP
jgi:hypothetical protein